MVCAPNGWQAPTPWSTSFQELGRLAVEPVQPGTPAARQWADWTEAERSSRLREGTNNTRFLILPWVRVPHLASHLLAQ